MKCLEFQSFLSRERRRRSRPYPPITTSHIHLHELGLGSMNAVFCRETALILIRHHYTGTGTEDSQPKPPFRSFLASFLSFLPPFLFPSGRSTKLGIVIREARCAELVVIIATVQGSAKTIDCGGCAAAGMAVPSAKR
jgi:hypothetical protein